MSRTKKWLLTLCIAWIGLCLGVGYWLINHGDATASEEIFTLAIPRNEQKELDPAPKSSRMARAPDRDPNPDTPTSIGELTQAPPPDVLLEGLEELGGSFLTDEPDFLKLARFWDKAAESASVVPESVKHEGITTVGEFTFKDSAVRAEFQITNGTSYHIAFNTKGATVSPYLMRTVSLSFREDAGIAAPGMSGVQYQPDTRQDPKIELADEERIVGWVAYTRRNEQTYASPIIARLGDDGQSWFIGRSGSREEKETPFVPDGRNEQIFLNLMKEVR